MRRKIIAAFMTAIMLIAPSMKIKAQLPVTDLASIASATVNAAKNLLQAMESAGISLDSLDELQSLKKKFESWNEDIKAAKEFIESVTEFYELAKMIESHVNFINSYLYAMENTMNGPYNPYALSYIFNYAAETIRAVDELLEIAQKIATEVGIDKANRQRMVQENIEVAKEKLRHSAAKVNDEIVFLQDNAEIVDIMNFMAARPAGTGVQAYGASSSYEFISGADNVSSDVGSGLQEGGKADAYFNSNGLGSIASTWFRIISLVIGTLCACSAIFAFVRYTQGSPGSEMMFVRIAAIGVIALVAFMLINKIVFGF